MSLTWPNHLLTLEDWEALPAEDGFDVEVVEGAVSVVPNPRSHHQNAKTNLTYRVKEQLPHELVALSEVEVLVAHPPLTIRAPDMVVTRTALHALDPARYQGADILLAVEVMSEFTRRVDRIMKFAEYAEAGISQYWIIDLGTPLSMLAYALVDGHYELSAEHTGTVTLDVAGHPVTLDLDALTTR